MSNIIHSGSRMLREMSELHGECVQDSENREGNESAAQNYYFADGFRVCYMDVDGQYFQQIDVPQDPAQKLLAVKQHRVVKLFIEEQAFKEFRRSCFKQMAYHEASPNLVPSLHPSAAEQLQAGKERVEALRAEIEEIDAELHELWEGSLSPEQRATREHFANQPPVDHQRQLRNELKKITI